MSERTAMDVVGLDGDARRFRSARAQDLALGHPAWAAEWFGGMDDLGITREWAGLAGVRTYLDAWNAAEFPCGFAPPDEFVRDSHVVTAAVLSALQGHLGAGADFSHPLPVDRYNAQDFMFQCGGYLPERLRPKRILEIGPGFGRQVNLWHRRRADLTFVAVEAIENAYLTQRFYYRNVPGARYVDYVDDSGAFGAFEQPGIYHLPTWRMDLLPLGFFDLIIVVQVLPELGLRLAEHLVDHFAQWLKPEGALYLRDHDLAALRGNQLDTETLLPARGFHREFRPLLQDKVDIHGIPRLWRKLDDRVTYRPVDQKPGPRAASVPVPLRESPPATATQAPEVPTVIYVAARLNFQIARQSIHLRRNGWKTILFSLQTLPDSVRDSVRNSFDLVSDELRDPVAVAALIERKPGAIVHILCWMFQYDVARRLIEALPGVPVVCEFQDITSGIMTRDDLCNVWPVQQVDRDLEDERFLFTHAAGVIHRLSDEVSAEIAARHGSDVPLLQFFPYPCPEYVPPQAEGPAKSGGHRLVYAGGLPPVRADHPAEYYPLAQMPLTVRALLQQGLSLTILHDPMRLPPEDDPGFAPYRALQAEFPAFEIRYGVPHDKLAAELAQFDYGLILSHLHPDVVRRREAMCRGDVGTKLFPYFEAGLPAIVNAEFTYMAGLIEQNGMGLGVHTNGIDRLRETLEAAPYGAYCAGVRRYVQNHGMDREIFRLIGFYQAAFAHRDRSRQSRLSGA